MSDLYDFTLEESLRLSYIKRWAIIEMSRQQSVAEHSWNVAAISMAICKRAGIDPREAVLWAVFHDLSEIVTGDIPSSLKSDPNNKAALSLIERGAAPELSMAANRHPPSAAIVKVADMIDAIQFAERFCEDTRRDQIIAEMEGRLHRAAEAMAEAWDMPLDRMIDWRWPGANSLFATCTMTREPVREG